MLLYLFLIVAPGALITALVGIRHQQLLFSVTFSFVYLISLVSLARNYIWSVETFALSYVALIMIPTLGLLLLDRKKITLQWAILVSALRDSSWVSGLALVAGAYLVWYIIVGPYTEVPADLYRRMEYIKYHYELIDSDSFGPPLSLWQLATQQGGFWYVLVAFTSHLTETSLIKTIYPTMLVNGLIFMLALYMFSNVLFRPLGLTVRQIRIASVLTCFFVAMQMGVTTFSFVRYYSMAPGILNMVVYFAAMVCVLNLLDQRNTLVQRGSKMSWELSTILLVLCFGASLVIHNQEALFIMVMVFALVVYAFYIWVVAAAGSGLKGHFVGVVLLASAAVALLLFMTAYYEQSPALQSPNNKVVALPLSLPNYGSLFVLNPLYQFAEVVTIWGLIVSVLFVAWLRFFKQQPLLVAGMLVPFLTVFNPVFVDVFLRIKDDHSLWRLCFLIPFYPVAGLYITRSLNFWKDDDVVRKVVVSAAVIALLVIPLSSYLNRYVRISNGAVAQANSYHLWEDLLDELSKLDRTERILTDPVTGYVISALTQHRTFRYKFFASQLYHAFPFVFDDYDDMPLARYRDWLLVINKRNGAKSMTGLISQHWPEDIMQVSEYYPEKLLDHLKSHPELFDLVWQQNGISIYRIHR